MVKFIPGSKNWIENKERQLMLAWAGRYGRGDPAPTVRPRKAWYEEPRDGEQAAAICPLISNSIKLLFVARAVLRVCSSKELMMSRSLTIDA